MNSLKSFTIKVGLIGSTIMGAMLTMQEPIMGLLTSLFSAEVAAYVYKIVGALSAILTALGVRKGRLDAETNTPLADRE